jgi:hypothetical protein
VSLTNVLTIVSVEWKAWLAKGPRSERVGGKNRPHGYEGFFPTERSDGKDSAR